MSPRVGGSPGGGSSEADSTWRCGGGGGGGVSVWDEKVLEMMVGMVAELYECT